MRQINAGVAVTGFSLALGLGPVWAEPEPAFNSLKIPSVLDRSVTGLGPEWVGSTSFGDPFRTSPKALEQSFAAPGPAWAGSTSFGDRSTSIGDPFRKSNQRGLPKSAAADAGFTGFHLSGPTSRHVREGWTMYGAFGPARFVMRLDDSSPTTYRFGGRPPGMPTGAEAPLGLPRNFRFGVQYRF